MFIKLGDFVIAINQIAFIKRIGAGCEVYLNSNSNCTPRISAGASSRINVTNEVIDTLKVPTVTDEEWDIAMAKLFST